MISSAIVPPSLSQILVDIPSDHARKTGGSSTSGRWPEFCSYSTLWPRRFTLSKHRALCQTLSQDMASSDRSAGSKNSGPKAQAKAPMASQKLGRTIEELEHAFSDWDSLGSGLGAPKAASSGKKTKVKPETSKELGPVERQQAEQQEELRKKTKKLLGQLRRQLNAL
jgi:hypothetical protein